MWRDRRPGANPGQDSVAFPPSAPKRLAKRSGRRGTAAVGLAVTIATGHAAAKEQGPWATKRHAPLARQLCAADVIDEHKMLGCL